jgi:hypothetical protein
MYGLAYVLIPTQFASLQVELDRALAPFMRGGEEEFPREKLTFEDATDGLARLHRARFRYNPDGWFSLLDGDAGASFDLSLTNLKEHLAACFLDRFEGTFAEIEPDFDAFVRRFTRFDAPDPRTQRYGHWLNPIGYWDWWELGGRFNGVITGERRPAAAEQAISSGPSRGRMVMGNLGAALGASEEGRQAEIEANVELVETLKAAADRNERHSKPTAVVLPIGSCADTDRWFDNIDWHETRPGTRNFLGVPPDADYRALVRAAYERFHRDAAAGVAYHF